MARPRKSISLVSDEVLTTQAHQELDSTLAGHPPEWQVTAVRSMKENPKMLGAWQAVNRNNIDLALFMSKIMVSLSRIPVMEKGPTKKARAAMLDKKARTERLSKIKQYADKLSDLLRLEFDIDRQLHKTHDNARKMALLRLASRAGWSDNSEELLQSTKLWPDLNPGSYTDVLQQLSEAADSKLVDQSTNTGLARPQHRLAHRNFFIRDLTLALVVHYNQPFRNLVAITATVIFGGTKLTENSVRDICNS